MFILEFILSILYVLLIIALVLIGIALLIPVGLLYLVYWILFKSWRPKQTNVKAKNMKGFHRTNIKNIIQKSMKANKDDVDSEDLKKDIEKYVDEALKSASVSEED